MNPAGPNFPLRYCGAGANESLQPNAFFQTLFSICLAMLCFDAVCMISKTIGNLVAASTLRWLLMSQVRGLPLAPIVVAILRFWNVPLDHLSQQSILFVTIEAGPLPYKTFGMWLETVVGKGSLGM